MVNESIGVVAVPRPEQTQTLDQKWERTDKAHKRVAALKKRIAKRVNANSKDSAEIHDIKSAEGVA